jgi:hypothetical protein
MTNQILSNIEYYAETVVILSKNGDPEMIAMYEEKLKESELELIQYLSEQPPRIGDITTIMYRTNNFGIVTPEIARHIIKNL